MLIGFCYFLSEYSAEQNALHQIFLSTYGKAAGRSVIFLMTTPPAELEAGSPARSGDMFSEVRFLGVRDKNRDEPKTVNRTNPDEQSDIGTYRPQVGLPVWQQH
ncbi:MAG: hypothetical protein JW798_04010 [Prolixibacteraceae bacterium]|nr:hypothetical protein [Prolixibacteraceae bacterium]